VFLTLSEGCLKRREKCAGVKLSLNSKVATEVLFFERGNVDKPLREREQGHCDQNSGSGIGYARGRY